MENQITTIESNTRNSDNINSDNNEDNEDNESYSNILNSLYKHNTFIFILLLILLGISFILLLVFTIINDQFDDKFILNQFCRYLVISITQYLSALLVVYKNVKVNYTRKNYTYIIFYLAPNI